MAWRRLWYISYGYYIASAGQALALGEGGLLGLPHPAFGHPLPEGEGLSLGRNEATLSQREWGWVCLFPARRVDEM